MHMKDFLYFMRVRKSIMDNYGGKRKTGMEYKLILKTILFI